MTPKKIVCVLLTLVLAVSLTSCASVDPGSDDLLQAPRLEGDLAPIQQALETAAGENITLKYPISGDYRSALTLKDLTGDGRPEAIGLYTTTMNKTVSMHINVISNDGSQWTSKGDLSLVANGVESISFSDLNDDGSLDIIVGWMIYGNVDKQVGIYTFDGNKLIQRAIEPYTNFICTDITADGVNDLSLVYLNSAEKTAQAKILTLEKFGISEAGQVALDGGVTSYSDPIVGKLSDGTAALYIDAVKGSGMITEIVWFEDGMLKTLYDPAAPEAAPTYRQSAVNCRDYNDDGIIDLPLSEILISTSNLADSDKVWFTNWSDFNGKDFRLIASTFMNYSDGYSLTVPERLKHRIHLIRRTQDRLRIFYSYHAEVGEVGNEIFRYIAVTKSDYESGKYDGEGYFLLEKTDTLVYLARFDPENELDVTEALVKEMFSIIK